ncbi:tetratricopeptide repeat protein [Streptomyces sp. NPDC008122]|uniref:tetratricopeptide repeat protein n=1 Tax=Streptomyces sp. NPDC008122 TaxID=3364810 RepID=UPI0036E9E5A3
MAKPGVSRQELIRLRRRNSFVGRRGELDGFRQNLGRTPDDPAYQFLFHVHGNAGVGKSTLVRQWEIAAAEAGASTVYLDDTVHGPLDAMEAILARLAREGFRFRQWDKQLDRLRQRLHEAQSTQLEPAAAGPDGQADAAPDGGPAGASLSSSVLARVGLASLGMLPGVGALAGALDPGQVAAGADRLRTAVTTRARGADVARAALNDPVALMTPVFLEELAAVARERPWLVFVFDAYERTGPAFDTWLYALACGDSPVDLPPNVQIVLAGQGRLDPRIWGGARDWITDVPLDVFTEQEARALLVNQGVTAEPVVDLVLTLSGRLPVLVHTLAQSRPVTAEGVEDPSQTAVELFLKWEEDEWLRAAALACALPLEFDEDIYREVVAPEAADRFAWIRTLAFVTDRAGRCHFHEVVRAPMVRLQRIQSPSQWRDAQLSLAEVFAGRRAASEEDLPEEDRWDDPQWRGHRLNEIYHLLCADPHRTLAHALADTVSVCANPSRPLRQWARMIEQASRDTAHTPLAAWADRLLAATENTAGAPLRVLDALLAHPGLDTDGQVRARMMRGWERLEADRVVEAFTDFDTAVTLAPQRISPLVNRALARERSGDRDAAIADLGEAVRLDPGDAWAFFFRGREYAWAGDHTAALADFDRAVELDGHLGPAWVWRGRVRVWEGRPEAGIADLDRAVVVDPHDAAAHEERARCLSRLDRYDDALRAIARALDIAPDNVWHRVYLADLLLAVGRREDALREVDRALADSEEEGPHEDSWTYAIRAWALHGLGRDTEAMDCLAQALSLESTVAEVFAQRGWLLWEAGRLDEAEEAFGQALSQSQRYPWALGGRGISSLYAGRREEGVRDLAEAISIQFGMTADEARTAMAEPVADLVLEHLPTQRAPITAAVRLTALLSWQKQWPSLGPQLFDVLALRPGPRLLVGAVRLLRQATTVLKANTGRGDQVRVAWSLRLLSPVQTALERLPRGSGQPPGQES